MDSTIYSRDVEVIYIYNDDWGEAILAQGAFRYKDTWNNASRPSRAGGARRRYTPAFSFSTSIFLSSTRRTLPLMVLGSSLTNSISRGYL